METRENCCVCLENSTEVISIENGSENYTSKLQAIVPELNWLETSSICIECSKELDAAFNFRLKCLKSHTKIVRIEPEQLQENPCEIEEIETDHEDNEGSTYSPEEDDENDTEYPAKIRREPKRRCKITPGNSNKTPSKSTIYTCQSCSNLFNSSSKLTAHCEIAHGLSKSEIKPFSCPECEKRFKTSTYLKQHLKYHLGTRSEVCSYCGKAFITKSDLFVHEKIHFNQKTYCCNLCEKSFNTHKNLGTHKLIVHTDPSLWNYVCSFCNKRFPQKSNMAAHVRRHKGEKLFECHLCQKKFCEKGTLKRHIATHSNVRNNKCSECGKEYKEKRIMEIHMAKIHGIGDVEIPVRTKKYFCHVCPKSYFDKNKLTRHMYKHTGEKPFSCGSCEKSFIDKSYLANHMRNAHTSKTDDEQLNL